LVVFNKSDRVTVARSGDDLARLAGPHDHVCLSAHDPDATASLRATLLGTARAGHAVRALFVPHERGELASRIYAACIVRQTHATARGTQFLIEGAPALVEQLARACRKRTA
jgi:50S ribosomal subunit-associated GTPase HflX